MLFAGIQLVKQSSRGSSLPRFLRGFGSLAGNSARIDFCSFVRPYCARFIHCAAVCFAAVLRDSLLGSPRARARERITHYKYNDFAPSVIPD